VLTATAARAPIGSSRPPKQTRMIAAIPTASCGHLGNGSGMSFKAERAGELADADRVGAGGQQVDDLDPVGVDICRCIRPAPLPPLAAKLWINLC
jgi:hypothetical protein